MKQILIMCIILIVDAICAAGQTASPWKKEVQLTSGPYDDINPAVQYTTNLSPFSRFQWLVFERTMNIRSMKESTTSGMSFIFGRPLNLGTLQTDTQAVIISETPLSVPQEHSLPAYCSLQYDGTTASFLSHCAAWQWRSMGGPWNICLATCRDTNRTWSAMRFLTWDSVDNISAHLQPCKDSLFILTWKRKNVILFSQVSEYSTSQPDTLVVTGTDSMEFDILRFWNSIDVIWTEHLMNGKHLLLWCRGTTTAELRSAQPETLLTINVYNPKLVAMYGDNPTLLFESIDGGDREVYQWSSYIPRTPLNISNDSLSSDRNARALQLPLITDNSTSLSGNIPFQVFVMEKYTRTDTQLVFDSWSGGDTLRGKGINRNAVISSSIDNLPIMTYRTIAVWEGNRDGRFHLYGRCVDLPWMGIENDVSEPTRFSVSQNYPNPFNSSTNIEIEIKVEAKVELGVHDILGREIALMVHDRMSAGNHRFRWKAENLPSGVYIYRVSITGISEARKMVLLR